MGRDESKPSQIKKNFIKNATAEQKRCIKYFIPSLFGKVSDKIYVNTVEHAVVNSRSYQKSVKKLQLEEDEFLNLPPLTLYGYEISSVSKLSPKKEYRSNIYSVTHIFCSNKNVYVCRTLLNTVTNVKKEVIHKYSYIDISGSDIVTETVETHSKRGIKSKPVTAEVQRFELIMPGDKFSCPADGDIKLRLDKFRRTFSKSKALSTKYNIPKPIEKTEDDEDNSGADGLMYVAYADEENMDVIAFTLTENYEAPENVVGNLERKAVRFEEIPQSAPKHSPDEEYYTED